MTNPNQPPGFNPQQPPGQFPVYPEQYGSYPQQNPQLSGQRPKDIDISFLLWLGAIFFTVLHAVLGHLLLDTSKIVDEATRNSGSAAPAGMKDLLGGITVFSFVLGLLLDGLWLFFVFMLRRGANWARVTMTVIGSLWVLSQLFGLLGSALLPSAQRVSISTPWWSYTLTVLSIVLVVAAAVFMYRPAANRFLMKR